MKHTRLLYVFISLGFATLLFQNCGQSGKTFTASTDVQSLECRETAAGELSPKLKWDWKAQLVNSPDKQYPTVDQVMAAPMVGDLSNDKKPEVVFISFSVTPSDWFANSSGSSYNRNGVLRIVDGATGKNKLSVGSEDLAPSASHSPLLIDLDGDGKMEIIYLHYLYTDVIALNHDGSMRWKYHLPFATATYTGLSASDVNHDGKVEIQVGNILLAENSSELPYQFVALKDASTSQLNTLTAALDPKHPSEVSVVNGSGAYDRYGNRRFSFSRQERYLSVADVYPEVDGLEIVATGANMMTVYNGLTGAVLSTKDLSLYNALKCPAGSVGGGPSSIGDFDGDPSTLEIAVATGQYLTIFNRNSEPVYQSQSQDCSSLATGVTSFDLNGDKKPEVLYADEEYLRIYEVEDGVLQIRHQIVNPSGTLLEFPIVADIDGNGSAELLVASNNYAVGSFYKGADEIADGQEALHVTGVRAFTSAKKNSWMPTRSIWNEYSFHPDQVNDHGRLINNAVIDGLLYRRNNQGYNTTQECTPKK